MTPEMLELAIHEHLNVVFDQMMGRVFSGNPVPHLHAAMVVAFRDLVLQDYILSAHCPIDIVVFEDGHRPGHVGWYFSVTDPKNILWISIHKEYVDRHFPAALFPEGRPELPVFPGVRSPPPASRGESKEHP